MSCLRPQSTIVGEDAEATCNPLSLPIGHTSHGCHRSNTTASPFQLNDRPHDRPAFVLFLTLTISADAFFRASSARV